MTTSTTDLLDALRDACERHGLRGWKSAVCGPIERVPTDVYLEAPKPEHKSRPWFRHFGTVRRGALEHLQADADNLARECAEKWREDAPARAR